jgi:hypothetical protein
LRILGRVTQGVRLINIGDKDEIASVAKINYIPGEEDEELDGEINPEGTIPTSDSIEESTDTIENPTDLV